MRFAYDPEKSRKPKANRRRGISFDEARTLFANEHIIDRSSGDPEQFRAIGLVKGQFVTLIFEIREDDSGEYHWFVTLWQSTQTERNHYEEYC